MEAGPAVRQSSPRLPGPQPLGSCAEPSPARDALMEHTHAHLASNSSACGLGFVPVVYYSFLLCLGLPGKGFGGEGGKPGVPSCRTRLSTTSGVLDIFSRSALESPFEKVQSLNLRGNCVCFQIRMKGGRRMACGLTGTVLVWFWGIVTCGCACERVCATYMLLPLRSEEGIRARVPGVYR